MRELCNFQVLSRGGGFAHGNWDGVFIFSISYADSGTSTHIGLLLRGGGYMYGNGDGLLAFYIYEPGSNTGKQLRIVSGAIIKGSIATPHSICLIGQYKNQNTQLSKS